MGKALSGIEERGINTALVSPRGDCGWRKTTLTSGSSLSAGERGGWYHFRMLLLGYRPQVGLGRSGSPGLFFFISFFVLFLFLFLFSISFITFSFQHLMSSNHFQKFSKILSNILG
jgi:hypothetical protein